MIPLLLSVLSGLPPPDAPPLPGDEEHDAGPLLDVDALAWDARPRGWLFITQGSRAGSATRAHVGDEFGLDPDFGPAVEARIQLGERHSVRLRTTSVTESGRAEAENGFVFHGTTFDAGRELRAELGFLFVDLDYRYTINPEDPLHVAAHAGVEYWKFSAEMKTADAQPPLDTRRSFSSGFWIAGADLEYRLLPWLDLRGSVTGGAEESQRFHVEIEAGLSFRAFPHLRLEAGYRYRRIAFHQSTNEADLRYDGPALGIEISF